MLLEDAGVARVRDAPPLVHQQVAVGIEGGASDLEVGRGHDHPVLEVPDALRLAGRGERDLGVVSVVLGHDAGVTEHRGQPGHDGIPPSRTVLPSS